MTLQLDATAAPSSVVRTRTSMVGMAALLGPLVGGLVGTATFLGLSALAALSGGGGLDGSVVLVVGFYGLWAFGVGAVAGLVQGLVAIGAVLLLGAQRHLTAARWTGAVATLVLPALTVPGGWVPGILVPFAVASAVAAASLMRVVTRRRVTVGL